MKNTHIIYIITAFLTLGISSCENELDIEPAESISLEKALSTENNIENVLIGAYEEIGQNTSFGGRTQVISDLLGNTDQVGWEGTFIQPRQAFSKGILVDNSFVRDIWGNSYEVINQVNLVLDNLDKIEDIETRNRIEGEAKFLRALSYFDLIRLFAQPFISGEANNGLGVPLRVNGIINYGEDLSISRNSILEVYSQIITDLDDSYVKLPSNNSFFADKYSAKALLSRVYLHQQNYAAARDAADDVINNSGHNLTSTFAQAFNNDNDSEEILFALQVTSQGGDNDLITFYASQANGGRQGDITLQSGFFNLFDDSDNDVRASFIYISPDNGGTLTNKYTNQFGNVPVLRLAEMYLTRAEANSREGTSIGSSPLDDINRIRARANAMPLSNPISIEQILNERQLELSFEGHLLHDIKRTQRSVGALPYNDNSLVLPIPQSELDSNASITQNQGY